MRKSATGAKKRAWTSPLRVWSYPVRPLRPELLMLSIYFLVDISMYLTLPCKHKYMNFLLIARAGANWERIGIWLQNFSSEEEPPNFEELVQ